MSYPKGVPPLSLPSSSITAKGIQQSLTQGWQQANTTASQLTNTPTGAWTTTGTATSQPYYAYPTPITYPTEELPKEQLVPIIDKTSRGGVFLRDDKGTLHHISAERIFKAFGIGEW